MREQPLNELLKKLEADDSIERLPAEKDQRVMLAHRTDAGRETELGARPEEAGPRFHAQPGRPSSMPE